MSIAEASVICKEFVSFLNKSVTPFHAVEESAKVLSAIGYKKLIEGTTWPQLKQGDKYFVTRNDSSIVAFAVGGKYTPGNGVKIVGAHTDSPNLALKPHNKSEREQYERVSVQCYGGGLWHTWFDRDLTVAGRVFYKSNEKVESKLIHVKKPIMRIPTLAIHLTSGPERDAFAPNKERHVVPVIATKIAAEVNKKNSEDNYSVSLFSLLAETLGCAVEDIVDFDLSVVDTQDAVIGGAKDEFIFSPRLDNLVSCFCALEGLKKSDSTLKDDNMIRMVCLFDHEEVGSSSSQGAGGTLIPDIIEYIVNGASLRSTLVANSFLLSVDGAHAVHPNYGDKHEENHRPNLHKGPVIKYNANTRYATNGFTGATVKKIAADSNIPLQEFVVKNDSPCGSTIGPILSTLSGIKTADMGNAMLSMHSIREMCGTLDILYLANFLESFFSKYNITP